MKTGKALLIVGPQGSGKGIVARKIAEVFGAYVQVSGVGFGKLNDAVSDGYATIIIDSVTAEDLTEIKGYIASTEIMRAGVLIKNKSNFIVCVDDRNFTGLGEHDRRFNVIKLNELYQG